MIVLQRPKCKMLTFIPTFISTSTTTTTITPSNVQTLSTCITSRRRRWQNRRQVDVVNISDVCTFLGDKQQQKQNQNSFLKFEKNISTSSSWNMNNTQSPSSSSTLTMVASKQLDDEVDPGVVEGTSLRILKYPHPLLRAVNSEIPIVDSDSDSDSNSDSNSNNNTPVISDEIKQVVREMLRIMYASSGVGLAAPQVGLNIRLLVFNPEGDSKAFLQEIVMVNPVVTATSKRTDVQPEACLSFPGMSGNVKRFEWIKVEGYRLNGKKFKMKLSGWKARIFQHEFDHLQSTLYVDHLGEEDRQKVQGRLDELIEEYRKQPYNDMEPAL